MTLQKKMTNHFDKDIIFHDVSDGHQEEMAGRIKQLQGEIYPVFEGLIKEIEAEYGTLICREMSQPFGEFDSKPRLKNCMEVIAYCARTVIKHAERK